ncbi:MAG: hypothetical protein CME06_14690 [Gemmatimonadetes bacterium]|nr:hypothetical protein [Gemmatimonadota bacterium]
MPTLSRETDAQRLPVFILIGTLDAVILSALDLITGDYIYDALGRLLNVGTPFVPLSLTLYLIGALLGVVCYGISRKPALRHIFSGPSEWIAGVTGVSIFFFGALLLLDLLFIEVFPRFDLPAIAVQFLVFLTLFNGLMFSAAAAALIYIATDAFLPPDGTPSGLRRLSIVCAGVAVVLVIAVFLANDFRVQRAAIGDLPTPSDEVSIQ